jgi:ubiquitin C-terminal hydrolase
VPIKGKKNLVDSLKSMVKGEILDGDNQYFCVHCNKKMKAVKRMALGYVPNTLIIHLKRIDFSFEEMRREKINDSFQFPVDMLDMYPYMKDAFEEHESSIQQSDLFRFILENQDKGEDVSERDGIPRQTSSPAFNSMTFPPDGAVEREEGNPAQVLMSSPRSSSNDSYKYHLVGIVVHSGGAEGGHYYSFIRERTHPFHWF